MEEIDAEHLIALVEQHPVIWDKSREDHRERIKVRDGWMMICGQLRAEFDSLRIPEKKVYLTTVVKRWRNIRDQWLKWRNKHQNPLKYNPSCRAYRRRYVYHNQLRFLEDAMHLDNAEMSQEEFFDHLTQNESEVEQPELLLRIKSSASTESLKSSEAGQDTEETEMEHEFFSGTEFLSDPGDPLCKKQKFSSEIEDKSEDDRHMMFFRSVIPYLKAFSERQILDFQMGVLQLVRTAMEPDPLCNNE